jgi:hypothetical protein
MPAAPAQVAGPPPEGVTVDIPPIESLYHDPTWLRRIKGRGFHGGILEGLGGFYA